jgi:hypothetical protein
MLVARWRQEIAPELTGGDIAIRTQFTDDGASQIGLLAGDIPDRCSMRVYSDNPEIL